MMEELLLFLGQLDRVKATGPCLSLFLPSESKTNCPTPYRLNSPDLWHYLQLACITSNWILVKLVHLSTTTKGSANHSLSDPRTKLEPTLTEDAAPIEWIHTLLQSQSSPVFWSWTILALFSPDMEHPSPLHCLPRHVHWALPP